MIQMGLDRQIAGGLGLLEFGYHLVPKSPSDNGKANP